MVNLIAERQIVPELIQHDMNAANIAGAAQELLTDTAKADRMRQDLARVRVLLTSEGNPLDRAAEMIGESLQSRFGGRVSADAVREKIK
jgi:lipid-A-disaccharide synthase